MFVSLLKIEGCVPSHVYNYLYFIVIMVLIVLLLIGVAQSAYNSPLRICWSAHCDEHSLVIQAFTDPGKSLCDVFYLHAHAEGSD